MTLECGKMVLCSLKPADVYGTSHCMVCKKGMIRKIFHFDICAMNSAIEEFSKKNYLVSMWLIPSHVSEFQPSEIRVVQRSI